MPDTFSRNLAANAMIRVRDEEQAIAIANDSKAREKTRQLVG
jgi:hypothetical protein